VRKVIKNTIGWPSTTQSLKGLLTGGLKKSFGYVREKVEKYRAGSQNKASDLKSSTAKEQTGSVPAEEDEAKTDNSKQKKN
jgi:translocator assembly and maintenance protein 41